MDVDLSLIVSLIAYLIALVSSRLIDKCYIPLAAAFTLFGFLIFQATKLLDINIDYHYYHFTLLTQNLFIPPILFSITIHAKQMAHWKTIKTQLALPILLFILTLGIATPILYFGLNAFTTVPFIAVLLTIVMLSGTDKLILGPILNRLHKERFTVESITTESIITQVLSIVIFGFVIWSMEQSTHSLHWLEAFWVGLWHIAGGLIIGAFYGYLLYFIMKIPRDGLLVALLTVVLVHLSFLSAGYVGASGGLAVFVFALMAHKPLAPRPDKDFVLNVWTLISTFFGLTIFYMLGFSLFNSIFSEKFPYVIFAMIAIYLPRFLLVKPLSFLHPTLNSPLFAASGLRGVIAVALAFSIPDTFEYWWTVQSMVFGVVLFDLFVIAPITTYRLSAKHKVKHATFEAL